MKEEHRLGKDFDFLIGKSIKKVKYIKGKGHEAGKWELICNDNIKIIVEENVGCGGCGNGWSSIDLKCLENNHIDWKYTIMEYINDEIEIIEEKENNKIEKLEIVNNGSSNSYALLNEYGTKCGLTKHSKIMCDKINELIDVINELRGKK